MFAEQYTKWPNGNLLVEVAARCSKKMGKSVEVDNNSSAEFE